MTLVEVPFHHEDKLPDGEMTETKGVLNFLQGHLGLGC